ncbi:MAG TPA: adenylyl-sulfate kinase [Thermodesulfobacteriota bacterium]|nr:adenylyl-sulfate kinase [Thermodesulfobacteriota bacterium]
MKGFTVWFTGLSGSGKTTLARMLEQKINEMGFHVEVLDGDEVRERLSKGLGFSKEDRDENIWRIAYVARLITNSGGVAITCAISPYREMREKARKDIGRFTEVYVNCPVEECIKRDVKGLYKKALKGEIKNFTGVSDPYEPPLSPEIVVETHKETHEESLNKIINGLMELGYITKEGLTGLAQVSIPKYLLPGLEGKMKEASFSDINQYVAHLIAEKVKEGELDEVSTEERNMVLAKLKNLGYLTQT